MKIKWKKIEGLKKPDGVLIMKRKLSDSELERLRIEWEKAYKGTTDASYNKLRNTWQEFINDTVKALWKIGRKWLKYCKRTREE